MPEFYHHEQGSAVNEVHAGRKERRPQFLSKVEPLFSMMRDSLKAWLDNFMLHNEGEEQLLDRLEQCLRICAERKLKISILNSKFFLKHVP